MMSALLIRAPYIDWILDGSKVWEIRGSRTTKLERIGLIQSGTGKVVGVADLVDVIGPLRRADCISNALGNRLDDARKTPALGLDGNLAVAPPARHSACPVACARSRQAAPTVRQACSLLETAVGFAPERHLRGAALPSRLH
jgi:hypothetical protein